MKQVDVAIIGGSLAGAACVRVLSGKGIHAVAFERDAFPREKVCGGFLSPGAVQILGDIGVLGDVCRAGAVEVRSARVRMRNVETTIELPSPGLGISRSALDDVLANHSGIVRGAVRNVSPEDEVFRLQLDDRTIRARVVIDAAGKTSRFTRHVESNQFGIQFYEEASSGSLLDFWFFHDGYGGTVSIENGRSNSCFLINKDALPRYLHKPGCRVTGPVAYDSKDSDIIAIGDAAGMIDPFCGEGMRHALDSGRLAAQVVADGLAAGSSYRAMLQKYRHERSLRWNRKRSVGRFLRGMLEYRRVAALGLRWTPEYLLRQIWA